MNMPTFVILAVLATSALAESKEPSRAANTVVLDETGVKNLRIETAVVEEGDFEESIFALGRIEAKPGNRASVTSRIPGRIVDLKVIPGDTVQTGQDVARVETRQPGDPPPTISLKAPMSGLITSVDTKLGDPVEPDRALMEITNLEEVYAVARVPEHFAGQLKPGASARITVAALPGEENTGTLLRFGTSADSTSGTIDAIFVLPNPSGLLRPEMRAEFSIVLKKRTGVMSVPRAALQGDAASRFVYVKDFDLPNAFVKTPVVIGEMNDRIVEIVSGLLPADEVVTRGAYSLAFAGGGSISLKEALDAAHGHEHNPDGSEMTPEQRKAKEAERNATSVKTRQSPFWMIVSGVLFVALLASLFIRKGAHHA